ncbi:MAG: thioesterase [Paracoccus sp. BP8]|nr:MAG: thioesterase [Paracoccus sp. BP8]
MPTLHGRVESWECDFNGHWNARFYARSFQLGGDTIPFLPGVAAPGYHPRTRHIRFHRELFVGAAIELRSALVADGPHMGSVAHLLCSGGRLSATCLDIRPGPIEGLPQLAAQELALALPRGLSGPCPPWQDSGNVSTCETGPLRQADLDHEGRIPMDEIIRRTAYATHGHVAALGLDETLLKETGISRMAVESRFCRLGDCPVGTPLRVWARVSQLGQKSFTVSHLVESHAGQAVALVDHNLITVDLNSRRAVDLPDFLRKAAF